jgi:hypothetical protein
MQRRKISTVLQSVPTLEGAGVHLKRAFGYYQTPHFDPFLLLDDFHSDNPADYVAGFPWHPHRGIETITYILEGRVEHGDSMGNQRVIADGDVQWMTAGSGIIHQEMPQKTASGRMWGFQLWANLPASQKMMAPRYREITAAKIPQVTLARGATVRIVSGEVAGVCGPVQEIVIDPLFIDVTVPAGEVFILPVKEGYTLFAYLLAGSGAFDSEGQLFGPEHVLLFEHAGTELRVEAGATELRFLLCAGKPLKEPIAWKGPIVMNNDAELRTAFAEYQQGTFIKGAAQ